MPERVRLSELAAMTPGEFLVATAALVRGSHEAARHGDPTLARRIRGFEVRYEMSSHELLARLASGEQRETAEVAEWLFCLAARDGGRAVR